MPKRKRPSTSTDNTLSSVLQQSKKQLLRALKTARGFERQKLGKRQKAALAEQNAEKNARLEEEVQALKTVDPTVAAEFYLYKTLAKSKAIAGAEGIPQGVLAKGRGNNPWYGNQAAANVAARLWNANPVKETMREVLDKVGGLLGVDIDSRHAKRKRMGDIKRPKQGTQRRPETDDPEVLRGEQYRTSFNSGSSLEQERYASRMAEISTEEDMDGNGFDVSIRDDDDSSPGPWREARHQRAGGGGVENEIDIDSASTTSFEEQSTSREKESHKGKWSSDKPAVTSTTFLPSLAHGYISGSESAPDTSDEQAAKIKPRKNRMGQQARRALWEKKFGSGANHVKKQGQSRDAGWDPRKGAQTEETRRYGPDRWKRKSQAPGRAKSHLPTGANSDPVSEQKRKPKPPNDKLHPSWEAAKKIKEQKISAPFQGKKVVFD